MIEATNSIILVGKIKELPAYDHTLYGEAFYKIIIAVSRLSGVEDVLPITVSERILGDTIIETGDRVRVSGQIRSYNHRVEDSNRLILTVFARDFEILQSCFDQTDINEVQLSGHICKPVIYRTTPFAREIADVLLAVNRRYGKSDYIPCIAWGRNARFCSELDVGEKLCITGRMQSRTYTKMLADETEQQRIAYEISCSTIETGMLM